MFEDSEDRTKVLSQLSAGVVRNAGVAFATSALNKHVNAYRILGCRLRNIHCKALLMQHHVQTFSASRAVPRLRFLGQECIWVSPQFYSCQRCIAPFCTWISCALRVQVENKGHCWMATSLRTLTISAMLGMVLPLLCLGSAADIFHSRGSDEER